MHDDLAKGDWAKLCPAQLCMSVGCIVCLTVLEDRYHTLKCAQEEVKILLRIGEGAFGEVSLATCAIFGSVAVKWLKVSNATLPLQVVPCGTSLWPCHMHCIITGRCDIGWDASIERWNDGVSTTSKWSSISDSLLQQYLVFPAVMSALCYQCVCT